MSMIFSLLGSHIYNNFEIPYTMCERKEKRIRKEISRNQVQKLFNKFYLRQISLTYTLSLKLIG